MIPTTNNLPEWLAVSRETHTLLQAHLDLVLKWTPTVNLISAASAPIAWQRHVLDSAQIWYAAGADRGHWVDLGSGGGFPGLVVAIIAKELAPNMQFTLVESDRRKATFLREAGRQLSLSVSVRSERVEAVQDLRATVVSARAMAPLAELLAPARRLLGPHGISVFPKGQSFENEILAAQKDWSFGCEVIPSLTDTQAVILRIKDIHHV